MPKYIFAYHHTDNAPAEPEDSAALMQRWQDWLASMGVRVSATRVETHTATVTATPNS